MNKRRLFAVICLFMLCSWASVFAHQGVMAGADKLRVTQTQWFDIIYAEENAATAKILYEKADDIYLQIAADYGIEPFLHIPVVITSTVEQFNAFMTNTPYTAIVMYDTGAVPDLSFFSETVVATFTHELTHALTYNHKDKAMRRLAKIFGDGFACYYITVTSGMAEGATVSYESSFGEGRLNDPYILQMLRQAKIEGKFPTYSDVKGAADTYPANSFYYFNGAFAEFLQRNFGMDKYAEFWYRCVNGYNLTAAGAFKKCFGVKINQAWKLFQERYPVPEVAGANPVELGQAADFFEPSANDYSLKNNAGQLYSDLCVSTQGVYYIDSSHSSVYFVDLEQLQKGGAVKPKRLFRHDYIDYLKVSSDGRFASVGYYSTMSTNVKHCAAIYDLQTKDWFTIPETGIVSPTVIYDNGQYYVVLQKYEPQKYSISVKKLVVGKKLTGLEAYASLEFGPEEIPSYFTGLGNGSFAFVKKAALDFSVCVATLDCREVTQYDLPLKGMLLRNLSAGVCFDGGSTGTQSPALYFSWATKETLPRLGILNLTDGQFELATSNISGGIYNPVMLPDGDFAYIAHFYRQNRLFKLKQASQQLELFAVGPVTDATADELSDELAEDQPAAQSDEQPAPLEPFELPYKPFNPFAYTFKGFLLPASSTASNNFMNFGSASSYSCPWGFTYVTSLPWTAGLFTVSGGYGIDTKSGVFSFDYQGGAGTSIFGYELASSVEFDKLGFKQVCADASVSTSFDFGTRSAVLFSLNGGVDYGRVSYTGSGNKVINDNTDVYLKNYQSFVATFSNVVLRGPGTYERGGFTFSAGVVHSASSKQKPEYHSILDIYDLVMGLEVRVPHLIPVLCNDNFTYNLPLKLKANLFPMSGGDFSVAGMSAEALLFGYDIQKAVPGISALYINAATITLKYSGGTDFAEASDYDKDWHIAYLDKYVKQTTDGTLKYRDYATIKLCLSFTPNIGGFADSQFRNNLYISYSFGKKQNLPQNVLDFGLEAKF